MLHNAAGAKLFWSLRRIYIHGSAGRSATIPSLQFRKPIMEQPSRLRYGCERDALATFGFRRFLDYKNPYSSEASAVKTCGSSASNRLKAGLRTFLKIFVSSRFGGSLALQKQLHLFAV
jgi:hypothetical protein